MPVSGLNIYLWIVVRSRYKEIQGLSETNEEYPMEETPTNFRMPASQLANRDLYNLSFPGNEAFSSRIATNRLQNTDAVECQN